MRLGIHTGLVVVGDVGGGTRQEQLALGETSNTVSERELYINSLLDMCERLHTGWKARQRLEGSL